MQGLQTILSLFRNKFFGILGQVLYLIVLILDLCTLTYFNEFNNTGARMLDSIYHMTLKLL